MKTYHRTEAAEAILREGFRDPVHARPIGGLLLRGVWVSDYPLSGGEGGMCEGDVLEVDFGEVDIAEYELVQDIGYREWCLPAAFVNANARVRLLTEDEVDELFVELMSRRKP